MMLARRHSISSQDLPAQASSRTCPMSLYGNTGEIGVKAAPRFAANISYLHALVTLWE